MENLWPDDIAVTEKKAPVTLLREQASMLGEKTQNLVIGQVQELPYLEPIISQSGLILPRVVKGISEPLEEIIFYYGFYIIAPALGNYRYRLLTILYNVDFYPVIIRVDEDVKNEISPSVDVDPKIIANSEEEFSELLKKIFHSQKTKKIISAILSQSITN